MTAGLSDDTFATVLLCAGLGTKREVALALSATEWNRLAQRLVRANWWPGDILRWGARSAASALELDDDLAARIAKLLAQTVPVAAEIDRLSAAGIRVISRADEAYAARLRPRLKAQSPPLLFYAGPLDLLNSGGVAIVGSRNVDAEGATFARGVGAATARAGATTISGAARGVDREGMFGALDAGGVAIGVMPDGLSRALRSPDVRAHVANDALLMISPFRPDARFEVWRAMGRNKVIYALADASVVVSSEAGKGGTWAGALENLRHGWSPLFVRSGENVPQGNLQLTDLGALPLSLDDVATANGDLLTDLLHRAEAAEEAGSSTVAQQTLDDFPAPISPGRTRSNDDERAFRSSNAGAQEGQLSLHSDFDAP